MKKESKYQAVVSFLKKGTNQEISNRQPLPSIRQLSLDFHCSKDTIQRALLELRHEQYLYAKPQSATMSQNKGNTRTQKSKSLTNMPAAYDDFRLCVNETLIGRENYLFNYYDNQEGLEDLRQSIHKLLFDQALYCKADQLVLTSGTQQALFILSQISFLAKPRQSWWNSRPTIG